MIVLALYNPITMETQEEVNTRFWRLVDGHDYRPDLVDADQVRQVLAENLERSTIPGSLAARIDVDVRGGVHNKTPLTTAIEASNLAVVTVLLKYGADCNRIGHGPYNAATPLHCAIRQGLHGLEMMQLLLDRGASTTAVEPDGTTCLHIVSCGVRANDWKARIQCLLLNIPRLKLPRLLSTRNKYGMTPLMIAIENSDNNQDYGDLAKVLINAGDSDLEIRCNGARTAMAYCIRLRSPLGAGPRVLRELLQHGANTETRFGPHNNTALHEAVEYNCGWAVEILLDAGADRDGVSGQGFTIEEIEVVHPEIMAIFTAFDVKRELHRQICAAFASG
jgi:ankyrin repeat protein